MRGIRNKQRKGYDKNVIIDGDEYKLEKIESKSKKKIYSSLINRCSIPGCIYGYDLHVHHIIPLKKGGSDTFDNYIVLCSFCHRNNRLHSNYNKKIAILTFKFFIEQDVLGFTSDDYSDQEFWLKLKRMRVGVNQDSK